MHQRRRGRPPKPLDPDSSSAARLGAEIRSRRQAQELTLKAFAARIGFSPQHVSEVELATAPASPTFVAACDRALEAGGALLALLPAAVYERATERHGRGSARRAPTPIHEDESPDAAALGWDVSGVATDHRAGDAANERLRHAFRHPSRVDPATVAQLRARVGALDARYVRAPSMSLLVDVGQCLGDVGFLRVRAVDGRVRQELCAAEAEAATLMGQLVWDASQRREHAAARGYLNHAIHASQHNEDRAAEGLALLRMSIVALYGEKNPKAGLALAAQAGEVTAAASEVLGGLAMLHAAEGHAMLRRRRDCERALSQADAHFDRIDATDPAIHLFSATQRGRMAGSCYLTLGETRRARSVLQETAHTLRDGSKAQAIVLGNLALAHVRLGAPDAATWAMHEAIDLVEQTRGGGGLNVVFGVAQELRRWRGMPQVQDVYDRLLGLIANA